MERLKYILSHLPDPSDPSLAARYNSGVRSKAWSASEQVLRMLTTLSDIDVRACIRLDYDPEVSDRQVRTTAEVEFLAGSTHTQAVRRLVETGPLSNLYDLERTTKTECDGQLSGSSPYGVYSACTEIVRNEDGWRAEEERRRLNPNIPFMYYLVSPFEADEQHDWMSVDRLLARFESPVTVEVIVHPTEIEEERTWHYRYITQLMQVNRYGDDLDPDVVEMGERTGRSSGTSRVRDPMADDVLRDQEQLHERLREPHLNFAIRCWARTSDQAQLVASSLAEASLEEGQYQILSHDGDLEPVRQASRDLEVLNRELLASDVWGKVRGREEAVGQRKLVRMCRLATVDELKSLFRLPVAQKNSAPRTIRRHTDPPETTGPSILLGDDLEAGDLPERAYPDNLDEVFDPDRGSFPEVRIDQEQFKKHLFVSGMSGSGKTVAVFNLLAQLARQDVPFLVIEPAKTEYRVLKLLKNHPDPELREMARSLRVYTIGNEDISPFRFNPLAHPKEVSRDEHIDALFSCFRSVLPLHGPLEGLLAEAITRTYADHSDDRPFPRLTDLYQAAPKIIEEKSYSPQTESEFSAALDVRLGMLTRRSIGKVFDCNRSVPSFGELFGENVILEMEYLTPEHASLVSLFLLTALREHARTARGAGEALQHVTILEEAHNIVGSSEGEASDPEAASPQASAAEYVTRMLAEMRALGEGIVIADQLPSSVAAKVVKNTGSKLAFRQVAEQDRKTLGATMLMDKTDLEELARLRPGESYVHFEDLHRPHRLRGLGAHRYLARGIETEDGELPPPPSSPDLRQLLREETWYQSGREARHLSQLDDLERACTQLQDLYSSAEEALGEARARLLDLRDGEAESAEPASSLEAYADHLESSLEEAASIAEETTSPSSRAGLPEEVRVRTRSLRSVFGQELVPRARTLVNTLRDEASLLKDAASEESEV